MRHYALLSLCASCLISVSGCGFGTIFGVKTSNDVPYSPKEMGGDLEVQRDVQFNDIPVPPGFLLRNDTLFSYQCAGFRIGNFHYSGFFGINKALEFYSDQLPRHGWHKEYGNLAITNPVNGASRMTLLYSKYEERVRVICQYTPDEPMEIYVNVFKEKDTPEQAEARAQGRINAERMAGYEQAVADNAAERARLPQASSSAETVTTSTSTSSNYKQGVTTTPTKKVVTTTSETTTRTVKPYVSPNTPSNTIGGYEIKPRD